jgi:hypothetical protein
MDTGIHLLPMKKALVGIVVSRGNFRKKERFCQVIKLLRNFIPGKHSGTLVFKNVDEFDEECELPYFSGWSGQTQRARAFPKNW